MPLNDKKLKKDSVFPAKRKAPAGEKACKIQVNLARERLRYNRLVREYNGTNASRCNRFDRITAVTIKSCVDSKSEDRYGFNTGY